MLCTLHASAFLLIRNGHDSEEQSITLRRSDHPSWKVRLHQTCANCQSEDKMGLSEIKNCSFLENLSHPILPWSSLLMAMIIILGLVWCPGHPPIYSGAVCISICGLLWPQRVHIQGLVVMQKINVSSRFLLTPSTSTSM